MFLQLGFVPMVVISSSEAAEEVVKANDLECCSRPETVATRKLSYDNKDISFAPYGEYWRDMRKVAVLELFSLKKVQSFRRIREEENDLMVKKLSESALKQSPADLNKTLTWLTSSILYRVALGQNFRDSQFVDKDRIEELVFEAVTSLGSFAFSDFFRGTIGRLVDRVSGQNKRLNRISAELDTIFQKVIDDHLKPERTAQDHKDIIDVMLNLIQSQSKEDAFKLTIDHVKGVLMDIFLAGIDTGAKTMIWAMTELARNPRVMQRAQTEIRSCIGSAKERITEDDIHHLSYLKLVIKETFRLHPAVPLLLPRETMGHVKIQGYDIPPKTQLQINVWAIGRDPELWTEPDEFMPERFIDSPVDYKGQHFELLPFGSGRRSCPGISMAVSTIELGLANLLYFFDWVLPDGMTERDIDMREAGTLTVGNKVPLRLVPVLPHL